VGSLETVFFDELPHPVLAERARQGSPVFVPVGQIEAHGPHLPVGTDLLTAKELCVRAAARVHGLVLPTLSLGNCSDFVCWPGYVVLRTTTLLAVQEDVVVSLAEQGFTRFAFVVPHGGNVHNTLCLGSSELGRRRPELAILCTTLGLLAGPSLKEITRGSDPDTCLALRLAPDRVHKERYQGPVPDPPAWRSSAHISGDASRLSRGFPDAVFANPAASEAEMGEALLDVASRRLAELVEDNLGEPTRT